MTTFDKREEGFEKKFALDEEQKFKAVARRNRLLGLWAAEKLGISGDAANAYAKEVVAADFEEAGDQRRAAQGAEGPYRQGRRCHGSGIARQDGRADGAGHRAGEGGIKAVGLKAHERQLAASSWRRFRPACGRAGRIFAANDVRQPARRGAQKAAAPGYGDDITVCGNAFAAGRRCREILTLP